jgi:hypothetical protein
MLQEITVLRSKLALSEASNRTLQSQVQSITAENKELTAIASNLLSLMEQ